MGNVMIVLDSQAGSCGKGKFIGYLAGRGMADFAIDNFMSNAGHTYVDDSGAKVMTQHLPTSVVNQDSVLLIGPGAAITPSILIEELVRYMTLIGNRQVVVHPRAMVILNRHCEKEKELIRSGSTFKGCGVAQAEKIMRVPGTQLFGDWWTAENVQSTLHEIGMSMNLTRLVTDMVRIWDTSVILNDAIDTGCNVMVEGSQGFDLDINYGLMYPHTTSRQCHAGQLLADCGISPKLVNDIMMIMRPYPIRISNQTNIGLEISSGGYDGSVELTWDDIRKSCGAPADVEFGEITTVTKKPRRVFEMNWDRFEKAVMINRPTEIALNFAQYLDYGSLGVTKYKDLGTNVKEFMRKVERIAGCPVTLVGTGARNCDIVDLRK